MMMKTLIAYGSDGWHEKHWNWCYVGEIVATHGKVCSKKKYKRRARCGCGVSFKGIQSGGATTQAIVSSISATELEEKLEQFYLSLDQTEKTYCQNHVDWLHAQLWKYQIGQILLVEKVPELHLIPDGFLEGEKI